MMQLLQTLLADREDERAERQANIAALQQIANQGHGNHDHPGSKLKNFQNTNPPVFSKTEEPLDADDWLQTMENNLEVAGVDENEKVLFATHYLAGPARAWWTSARALNAGQMMTWADFKLKFSKYHVPPGLIKKMRDEFRELKQGRMSVVEYRDRFLTLSRYAPDETDTTEKRKERFLNGLHDEMQTVLVNIPFADLEALVDSAIQMEGKLHQANENRKRRMMHQSGPSNTPRAPANNNPNNSNTAPRTGSNAIPVTPKDKATITCYECGVVGHYSNECPKRLAKLAGNTSAPAQQQRRVSTGKKFAPNNPNNRGGRLYHMNAEEAQEAPDVVLAHATMSNTSTTPSWISPYTPLIARTPTEPGRRAPTTSLARRERHGDVAVHGPMEPNEPLNTKFYQLGNGGELIFEHDLNALSDFLGRPHPEFHGIEVNDQVGGELQWIITADLRGKLEPPTSERILFSFRESNWLDGLARGLQEALARLCGQNVVRILASRYAHLVRRDAMGVPMELQSHPQLRHHAEHLDYMLYHTQKELDNSRAYANQTHLALITHGDAIKQLSRDRNKLRLKCAKKDVTITRLRAQIASLEATVKAQEEQLMEIEEDEAGADLRGGDAFLSDDDDYEEDEFTEEEDYAFLEPGPDDVVPIDIEDEGSHT
ncbi:hypothetical protein QYE76_067169 [Lolium multiflorum]|uniref:CCHC-type domain-containing protein n=1 Tax=Lolium multiflorum TaxID=4521 RepID=A0AAD8SCB4_LOLMU|nr:hypothetical protein QYE76_067169 [Lolium multiflorum]